MKMVTSAHRTRTLISRNFLQVLDVSVLKQGEPENFGLSP